MIFENQRINEAYSKIQEADALKRSPAKVVTHGEDEFGDFEDGRTLDSKINLRGKAASLRDDEVAKASHYSNIIGFYENNKERLEQLEKDLENEKLYSIAATVDKLLSDLEFAADEASENLEPLTYDVRKDYHVGQKEWMDGPNTVQH